MTFQASLELLPTLLPGPGAERVADDDSDDHSHVNLLLLSRSSILGDQNASSSSP